MRPRGGLWGVAWFLLLAPLVVAAEEEAGCVQDDPAVIRQPRAPESEVAGTATGLDLASRLEESGAAALDLGDLARAERDDRRALAIRQKLAGPRVLRAPGSLLVADSLHALGSAALERGELATARSYFERALQIRQALAPGSRDFALSLIGLGNLERRRGNIALQEAFFRQALQVGDALTQVDLADIFDGLGNACSQRPCGEKPRDYLERALRIRQQVQPDSLGLANTLS